MASCPVPEQLLQKLAHVAESIAKCLAEMPFSEWPYTSQCPHNYYGSAQLFVDHIAWYLRQTVHYKDLGVHHFIIGAMVTNHSVWSPLCGRCRNLILSSSDNLLRLCSDRLLSTQCATEIYVHAQNRFFLFFRLVDHPRMAKVVMRIYKDSVSHWDSMCGVFHGSLFEMLSGEHEPDAQSKSLLVAYSDFLTLSVKYWSKAQFAFAKENIFRRMNGTLGTKGIFTWSYSGWRESLRDDTIFRLTQEVISRIKSVPDSRIIPKIRKWGSRSELRKDVKQRTSCSYLSCSKPQRDSNVQFKLCGGCKLTYYCCRSCQKKAWPHHKPICLKLRHLYAL